jgi:hypothetical protein
MDCAGVPEVPLPKTFLFDSNTHNSAVFSRTSVECTTSCAEQPREPDRRTADRRCAASSPVESLAGCKIDFLLRPNAVECREQGLELHVSQLRAALSELLGVHSHSHNKVQRPFAGSPFMQHIQQHSMNFFKTHFFACSRYKLNADFLLVCLEESVSSRLPGLLQPCTKSQMLCLALRSVKYGRTSQLRVYSPMIAQRSHGCLELLNQQVSNGLQTHLDGMLWTSIPTSTTEFTAAPFVFGFWPSVAPFHGCLHP